MSFLITWFILFLVAMGLLYKFGLPQLMAMKPSRDDFLGWAAASIVVALVATPILTFLLLVTPAVLVGLLIIAGLLAGARWVINKLYDRHTKS